MRSFLSACVGRKRTSPADTVEAAGPLLWRTVNARPWWEGVGDAPIMLHRKGRARNVRRDTELRCIASRGGPSGR